MTEEFMLKPITPETCFVPATHQGTGRRIAIAPHNTAARFLHYGRITLAAGDEAISFENDTHETGLVCLKGKAKVSTGGQSFELSQYDSMYIPRDSQIKVGTSEGNVSFVNGK